MVDYPQTPDDVAKLLDDDSEDQAPVQAEESPAEDAEDDSDAEDTFGVVNG